MPPDATEESKHSTPRTCQWIGLNFLTYFKPLSIKVRVMTLKVNWRPGGKNLDENLMSHLFVYKSDCFKNQMC